MNIYIENGNAVKTNWDDSIILSYFPTVGIALPYDVTIEKYSSPGGDFAGETLTITPVLFANKYWVVKSSAGVIQTTHYFDSVEFTQSGEYRFIYSKSVAGVVSLRVFRGKESTDVVYDTTIDAQYLSKNKVGFEYTLNDSVPNGTDFEGILEYRTNQVCIGTAVELDLGGTERARCSGENSLYTHPENQLRFYVKEKGSYTLLDDTDADTKEVSKTNLLADNNLQKGNIIAVVKLANELAVDIKFEKLPDIKVTCGSVSNKSFTEDIAGLTLMYNTIQSWL